MKKLAIPAAALVLLSSLTISGAHAAPFSSSTDTRLASVYTQIDCMDRDGGPTGFCDNVPDMGSFSQDRSRQHTASDQLHGYRGYFDNNGNAKANTNADAQYYGIGR